jgi:hypothetical protein
MTNKQHQELTDMFDKLFSTMNHNELAMMSVLLSTNRSRLADDPVIKSGKPDDLLNALEYSMVLENTVEFLLRLRSPSPVHQTIRAFQHFEKFNG